MKPSCTTVFLTGITGSLGSHIAGEMLLRGAKIVALVRGNTDDMVERRVQAVLDMLGMSQFADRITIVRGTLPSSLGRLCSCGSMLSQCSAIVHCAAHTQLDGDDSNSMSHEVNVLGVQSILDLAAHLSVPLVHLSTAYVAGTYRGIMKESYLDVGQRFKNPYERTKFEAEQLVRDCGAKTRIPIIILRPSIIVGEFETGRILRCQTIIPFMRTVQCLSAYVDRIKTPIRLMAKQGATLNLVPVDYCRRVACDIIERAESGTYHITKPTPLTMQDLTSYFAAIFAPESGRNRIRFVDEEDFLRQPPSAIESALLQSTSTFLPYMQGEPTFDRSATDALLGERCVDFPELDQAFFARLAEYARSVNWWRRPTLACGCDATKR